MPGFESTSVRLWRSLSREERVAGARAFWRNPPEEVAVAAAQEIMKILRVRPQAFGRIAIEERARATAGLANPPERLADALLIALHLEDRRELLGAFLDAVGIAHENGLIAEEEATPALSAAVARRALAPLLERFGAGPTRVYWNTLWLQDRERWGALAALAVEIET